MAQLVSLRQHYGVDIGVADGAPQTDDELHAYIKEATGYHVPRVAVVEGHSPPFAMIADFFFGRVTDAVALAGRETGKTVDMALLHIANARWKPNHTTTHFGAVMSQATRCATEYRRAVRRSAFDDGRPKERGRLGGGKEFEWPARFGSLCEILPGTEAQTQSGHPHLVSFDEAEQSKYQSFTNAKGMPSEYRHGDRRIVGQFLTASTRQFRGGRMQAILDDATAKGIKVYEWNVLDSMEPCDGQSGRPSCVGWECPIARWCMGGEPPDVDREAYDYEPPVETPHHCDEDKQRGPHGRVVHADGYRSYEQILAVFNRNDIETWESQHLCIRPESASIIYSTFTNANRPPPTEVSYYVPGEGRLLLGYDWGWTDPTILGFVQEVDGLRPDGTSGIAWYVFDELVDNQHDGGWYATEVVKRLCALEGYEGPTPAEWNRMRLGRLPWPGARGSAYAGFPAVWPAVVAGDPSAVQLRQALRAAGIGARSPKRVKHEVAVGQQVLRAYIASGGGRRLYVDPVACPVTVEHLERYGAKRLPDGSYTELPDPSPENHQYSHGTDWLRYLAWANRRRFGVTVDSVTDADDGGDE